MSQVETGTEPGSALPRGLLGMPGRLPFQVGRQPPDEDLAWLIERFWSTSWDVPAGRKVTARVLPHPTVNLTVEGPSGQDVLILTGIAHGVFTRTLSGRGDVLGLKFEVGAFVLISSIPVQRLSPHGAAGADLLPAGRDLQDRLRGADRTGQVRILQDYLRALRRQPNEEMTMVRRAAAALIHDPGIGRVAEAAALVGVSERTLQRLFARWVGVSPGWVLRRGRLHAAAERLIQSATGGLPSAGEVQPGPGRSLATIAADFGYVDQAHFTNDFRRILGEPPATWAARLVQESAA